MKKVILVGYLLIALAFAGQTLAGKFGTRGCTASSTAWTIPNSSVTVLPPRGNRAGLVLSNISSGIGANIFYRFDGVAVASTNGIGLLQSSTTVYGENYKLTGATTAIFGGLGSGILVVTECIYN